MRCVFAVKEQLAVSPAASLLERHLHVPAGLAEQSACSCLIVFDSPVWQLISRIKGAGEGEMGDEEGGKSSRTYCGSAVVLRWGSAKDGLHNRPVARQPRNSSLVLIDFLLLVLGSDSESYACVHTEQHDLRAPAAPSHPRICFQPPGLLGQWTSNNPAGRHNRCQTAACEWVSLQVKLV